MPRFAERLKILRKLNKLTQFQLSKKLDYGYTAITNYESGRTEPSYDTLIKLSRIFNVTTDYLLGVEPECVNKEDINTVVNTYTKLSKAEKEVILMLLDIFIGKQ